jgi:hypothetical protein
MKLTIDIHRLKKHLVFDYLQVFEVNDIEQPVEFVEHPVPKEVTPPKDSRLNLVSNRILMRFAREPKANFVIYKKAELLKGWEFNAIISFVRCGSCNAILVLYTRALPDFTSPTPELSNVVNCKD